MSPARGCLLTVQCGEGLEQGGSVSLVPRAGLRDTAGRPWETQLSFGLGLVGTEVSDMVPVS